MRNMAEKLTRTEEAYTKAVKKRDEVVNENVQSNKEKNEAVKKARLLQGILDKKESELDAVTYTNRT
jgi:hypothetical protein